jgi:hypothetical protein
MTDTITKQDRQRMKILLCKDDNIKLIKQIDNDMKKIDNTMKIMKDNINSSINSSYSRLYDILDELERKRFEKEG